MTPNTPHIIHFPKIVEPALGYIYIAEGADFPLEVKRVYWTITPRRMWYAAIIPASSCDKSLSPWQATLCWRLRLKRTSVIVQQSILTGMLLLKSMPKS